MEIQINGKYNTAKIFTDIVDNATISQIQTLCNQEVYRGNRIRIMPDCHAGTGCVVGTTMQLNGAVTPNLVGVDIGCVDKDTEVMTPTGWLKIGHWNGEEILQYSKHTDEASFTKPINYIVKNCETFFHFKTDYGLDQVVSDEHKVLVWTSVSNGRYELIDYIASDLVERHNSSDKNVSGGIKTTFNYCGKQLSLSDDEIKLYTMLNMVGMTKNTNSIGLHFNTHRKLERAEEILSNLGITYNIKSNEASISLSMHELFNSKYAKSIKEFIGADRKQISLVIREAFFWNGITRHGRKYLNTTIRENADIIQFMLAAIGIRAEMCKESDNTYTLYTKINEVVNFPSGSISKIKSIDGKKYCFTVPTGYFVIRRKGNISITGNCGMLAVKLKEQRVDLSKFDSIVKSSICSGKQSRRTSYIKSKEVDLDRLVCKAHKAPLRIDNAYASIGTLGGGNHFIELERDSNGFVWLIIHTGSRHLGIEVCNWYQKQAYLQLKAFVNGGTKEQKRLNIINGLKASGRQQEINRAIKDFDRNYKEKEPSVPYELSYCSNSLFEYYMHDMSIVQKFASINRQEIANIILRNAKLHAIDSFETIHNYIDIPNMILRKGAVSAQAGEVLIIPINMRDGSLLCVGKGNPDWNYSAPHGAGRLFSRSEAKEMFSLAEFKRTMADAKVYSSSVTRSTIDECPMAYKPMESILDYVKDTVDTVDILKPIYNFKASDM